jgi:hypothetical protein
MVDVDTNDTSLRETLSHHESYQASTSADVEHRLATLSPCSKKRSVRPHFHGTTVLSYRELMEFEVVICHKRVQSYTFFVNSQLSILNLQIFFCNFARS